MSTETGGQLVLSRQKDEKIFIYLGKPGKETVKIEVMIIDVRGDKVRVGTTAPKEWTVDREEIYDRKVPVQSDSDD